MNDQTRALLDAVATLTDYHQRAPTSAEVVALLGWARGRVMDGLNAMAWVGFVESTATGRRFRDPVELTSMGRRELHRGATRYVTVFRSAAS